MDYHIPVLLQESIDGLRLKPEGVYVDATFGGGGHSREILKNLKTGRLIAFDQDPESKADHVHDERFLFVRHNFRYLKNFLRWFGFEQVDGVLADLGVSSHQLDSPERGFSYREDTALDMRMNPYILESAADVLNSRPEDELKWIFRNYGELPRAGELAAKIVAFRAVRPLATVGHLMEALEGSLPAERQAKYLSRLFQAIRIEVNQELECLKELLEQCTEVIRPGGRLVVITYHSLEDRMVKNFIRSGNTRGIIEKDLYGHFTCPFRPVNRRVIIPDRDEIRRNKRARSAKLRIAERVDE
ncbi:MAG TPA: 16S rRNA (cytosine(1402)-N(4))-methyltransferase RsmH [Bacteroidetes bacterium]|nr:16S rRNA (cytosine(1402)-N(4))-methyltransferase RsmH [Bacteroidota bacterium]